MSMKSERQSESLFTERLVPAREDSGKLFEEELASRDTPIECLGRTFENDEARREYFLDLLRQGLEELHAKLGGVPFTTVEDAIERMKLIENWPMGGDDQLRELADRMREGHRNDRDKDLLQLWKDEVGFPHGEIEDILNLSDPPYYTACPNPFISDFIKHWGKPYDPENDNYRREPFAADVSEGKNDPIYNAHSYHTKVPHKAIMRYILHYTDPGDVILDGFAGTGMTGVAAQLCGDRETLESLGYRVDDQGVVYRSEVTANDSGKEEATWIPFSKVGARSAVLNDLSPAASFIAYNFNNPLNVWTLEREARRILDEAEIECGWMYRTLRNDLESDGNELAEQWGKRILGCVSDTQIRRLLDGHSNMFGTINYIIWSEVFICPECLSEIVFWEAAVDKKNGRVLEQFACPHCSAQLSKRRMERTWETKFDPAINDRVQRPKQFPVLINYTVDGKRYEKAPDAFDLMLIQKIEELDVPCWYPTYCIPEGDKTGEPLRLGISHVHYFYTKRNLWVLSKLNQRWEPNSRYSDAIRLLIQSYNLTHSTLMSRVIFKSQGTKPVLTGYQSGTLYVSSLPVEKNVLHAIRTMKLGVLIEALAKVSLAQPVETRSATFFDIQSERIDYIFTDPPFGGNLMYSELNFLWEAWLRVFTNSKPEAIENAAQKKGLLDYQILMTQCFKEYFRLLKPGRWMTVEFHNSKNSVWNTIQEALQAAGFVIADVRTLDKKQGSFNQVTQAGAVKQDIIISCYKPNRGFADRFRLEAGTEEGVWDFVRTHLKQLPVFVSKNGKGEVIAERQSYLLFDRMVAFHVQRGVAVPMSAAEFYAGLDRRFPKRDEMYFLPDQIAEYDKKRMTVQEVLQLELFVTDEASAIQWLKRQLAKKPQTFQELHPQFLREIGGWQKYEKPLELSELLEQNFLRYDGAGEVPSQIHSYLSSNFRELRNLPKDDERLRAKAKDRWYVPDPNKAGDLEKLRERALLREFEEYRASKQKRLRVFRLEAVRAGFKKAWQERDYITIIDVARKIPENVLQEDPKILMWYDQAVTRSGEA